MSESEEHPKESDSVAFFRKRLEEDPSDCVARTLLEMAEGTDEPITLYKPLEIEDEDPIHAGRHGECDVALEVLLKLYPSGEPHRLTTDGHDFAHVFLMYRGTPMDICGTTNLEEMKRDCGAEASVSEPIQFELIRQYFRDHRSSEETRRYRALFRKHILANVGRNFPVPELAK